MRIYYLIISLLINKAALALPAESPHLINHNELTRVVGALFCVLIIILALSWLVKRLNVVKLSSSKGFQSIATMTLGPKERVMLLQVGGRYLLIGIGAGAVSTLCDFGQQLPSGFELDNKANFKELLKSAVGKS